METLRDYTYEEQTKLLNKAYCESIYSLTIQRIEEKHLEKMHYEMNEYAEFVFTERVLPFLIKNKCDFVAGNGGYCLTLSSTGSFLNEDEIPLSLYLILNGYGINGYPLGSCMPDFKYRDYIFKLNGIS